MMEFTWSFRFFSSGIISLCLVDIFHFAVLHDLEEVCLTFQTTRNKFFFIPDFAS